MAATISGTTIEEAAQRLYDAERTRQAIPPLGESKSNWEVMQLLATAMGFQEPWLCQSVNEVIEEVLGATAEDDSGGPAQRRRPRERRRGGKESRQRRNVAVEPSNVSRAPLRAQP